MTRSRLSALIVICLGSVLFLWLGTVLQRTTTDLFASPDETAVMRFAQSWNIRDGFRVAPGLPTDLMDIAGLHGRSLVRDGAWLVPVGFLGMPLIVAMLERMGSGFGVYFTPLLVLSSAIPLYLLIRSYRRRVALFTVIFYLSFPTVLLYSNRALFPNLPVLACALWALWAWRLIGENSSDRHAWREQGIAMIAGMATGLAGLIRPTELIWILPWIGFALAAGLGLLDAKRMSRPTRAQRIRIMIASIIAIGIGCIGWWVARQTYGGSHGLIPIGYLIHDQANIASSTAGAAIGAAKSFTLVQLLPFGIHPRTLWTNIHAYLFTSFGLWVGCALIGVIIDLRRTWMNHRQRGWFYLVTAWTVCSLLFLYGQSVFTDNITGQVTLGNSFLRYLLPVAPLIAFGCAVVVDAICARQLRGMILGVFAVTLLVLLNIVTADARDDEGILRTRYELRRYQVIRLATDEQLSHGSVILSERSEKIFESGPYVSVSPIPSSATLERLQLGSVPVYYFTRTFTSDVDASADPVIGVFGDAIPIFHLQNETLYALPVKGAY